MLTEVKKTRHRTTVLGRDDQGRIECTVYPTLTSKLCFALREEMASDGVNFAALKSGDAIDVLLAGNNEPVSIEKPQIHPFDIKNLHPNGLLNVGAVIQQPAEGVYGPVIARSTEGGVETLYRITSLTGMFQAQADEELRAKIYNGLKAGASVNLWVKRDAATTVSGQNPDVVIDVEYLSVNYR